MKNKITKRQKELLAVIYEFVKNSGYPPTFEEMRDGLGVSSNQTVIDHLEQLEKKKFVKRNENAARSVVILPLGYEALGEPPLAPFLGATSAGVPLEMLEVAGEWQSVPGDVVKFSGEVFLLKIAGDSMINAGINDGGIVLVKRQKEFISGDIVLAQIGDKSTVKRFISEDKPPYVYLKPENPNHKILLFTDEVKMVGKVISILNNNYWKSIK